MKDPIKTVNDLEEVPMDIRPWDEFIQNTWEKEPKLISQDIAEAMELVPPILPDDFFAMALKAVSSWVLEKHFLVQPTIRFYVDGENRFNSETFNRNESDISEVIDYLPKAEDRSFDGYNSRLEKILENEGKNYILIIEPFEPSPVFRDWFYGIMHNLYLRLGYIVNDSYMSIFYGNYDKTPFGAHVHDEPGECMGAFFFSIKGEKKIRMWTDEFIKTIPDHPNFDPSQDHNKNYEPFNDSSLHMSIIPGEVMYWTADTWHVAENQTNKVIAFPFALSVANDITSVFLEDILLCADEPVGWSVILDDSQIEFIVNILNLHLEGESSSQMRDTKYPRLSILGSDLQKIAQENPIELEAIATKLEPIFSENDLKIFKSKFWLKVLTSYGFTMDFHRKCSGNNFCLDYSFAIRLYRNIFLLWKEIDGIMMIAATGKILCIHDFIPKKAIKKFIEILNTKEMIRIEEIVDASLMLVPSEHRVRYNKKYFLSILQDISSWQIFEVAEL